MTRIEIDVLIEATRKLEKRGKVKTKHIPST